MTDFPFPESLKNYPGSKGGDHVYPQILSRLAMGHNLIIPFLGSGQIARRSRTSSLCVNDIDRQVCDSWRHTMFVHNLDWSIFLRTFAEKGATIYADPPYILSTRSRRYYENEMCSVEEHEEFLDYLLGLCCGIAISHPRHPLYEEKLKDWHVHEYEYMSRGGMKKDCLWTNYNPSSVEVYRPDLCGDGFVNRQAMKRKVSRVARRYERLTIQEKQLFRASALGENGLSGPYS